MKRILCILSVCAIAPIYGDFPPPQVTVSGQGKTSVKTSMAVVKVGIEVEGNSASEVQTSLAQNLQPVLQALKKSDAEQLETGFMNISPEYNKNTPPEIAGYRGNIEISFTKETDKAGTLVDEALRAGANKLISVNLKPSDSDMHDARIASLKKACQNAMEEAQVVVNALNIRTNGIEQVDIEAGYNPGPIPVPLARNVSFAAQKSPSSEILNQEQTVNANVNIKLGIKTEFPRK
jgi:uncharacterized protein